LPGPEPCSLTDLTRRPSTRKRSPISGRPEARPTWLALTFCTENGCAGQSAAAMRASTCEPLTACSKRWEPERSRSGPRLKSLPPEKRPDGAPRLAAAISRPRNSRSRPWLRPVPPTQKSPRSCLSVPKQSTTTSARSSGSSTSVHAVSLPARSLDPIPRRAEAQESPATLGASPDSNRRSGRRGCRCGQTSSGRKATNRILRHGHAAAERHGNAGSERRG